MSLKQMHTAGDHLLVKWYTTNKHGLRSVIIPWLSCHVVEYRELQACVVMVE
jgi:hypothetical protein